MYYVGLFIFDLQCFANISYVNDSNLTNVAMCHKHKQVSGRVQVLQGHATTVAHAREGYMEAVGGFYNLLPPQIGDST